MLAGRIEVQKQSLGLDINFVYPSMIRALCKWCKYRAHNEGNNNLSSIHFDDRYIDLAGLSADITHIAFVPTPADVEEEFRRDWWLWSTISEKDGPYPLPAWWTEVGSNARDVSACISYAFPLLLIPCCDFEVFSVDCRPRRRVCCHSSTSG